jgi:hypothetical protein
MLQQFLIPHLDEDDQEGHIHFQQDGAPPHYLEEVHEYLNTHFPDQWIGGAALIAWPPRSPDHTPLDLLLWGFVKDREFILPLPAMSLSSELELLPTEDEEVTIEMLCSVWQDIYYRWDVCRITNGSRIEP